MRQLAAVTIALITVGGLAGCIALPNGNRLAEGPAAERALSRAIGAPMHQATNAVTPTGIDGQSFTYYGTAHGLRFTLIVFDNAAATRFVLGNNPHLSNLGGVRVLRQRNIVLFYTTSPMSASLTMSLQRALSRIR